MLTYTLIAAFVIMLASLSGVFFAWHGLRRIIEKNAAVLTTFSLGIFGVVVFSLIRESSHSGLSPLMIFLWSGVGVLILEVLTHIIPGAHHHHETVHHKHDHSRIDARRMLIGDGIHNIGDGILLVPAFLIDVRFGIATTLGIFFHELVQEIAEFFVLKEAGYSTKRALVYNFSISSTILIGIAISILIADSGDFIAPLLAVAAGGFLYLIARDLLPHAIHAMKCTGCVTRHIVAGLLGTFVMFAIGALTPHSHETTHEHGAANHEEGDYHVTHATHDHDDASYEEHYIENERDANAYIDEEYDDDHAIKEDHDHY